MIVCPWCGTNYQSFQPNCQNCGGPLREVKEEETAFGSDEKLPTPPAAPRPISDSYMWRLLYTDGWSIAALVFTLIGVIFSFVGTPLTLTVITAFVGIPFLLLGVVSLGGGGFLLKWRFREVQRVVRVLREGEPARGQITELQENYSVIINGRHPWIIGYEYQVNGHTYTGSVTTLNHPAQQLQVGKAVRVLYLAAEPEWSSIYPRP